MANTLTKKSIYKEVVIGSVVSAIILSVIGYFIDFNIRNYEHNRTAQIQELERQIGEELSVTMIAKLSKQCKSPKK